MSRVADVANEHAGIVRLLVALPAGQRGSLLQGVLSFRPAQSIDIRFVVGALRAAFAEYWEQKLKAPVPFKALRDCLAPPVPIGVVLRFNALDLAADEVGIAAALEQLSVHLAQVAWSWEQPRQECLFELGDRESRKPRCSVEPTTRQTSRPVGNHT